ncbi:MAG: ZIP family metal transporter [Saprospiraceae bacterium]|nr:ZIP family metal transporter [Saprospiraceae bacterium]
MALWEYLALLTGVLISGGAALLIKSESKITVQILLSFSGAYILGITVLHLMPSVFSGGFETASFWLLGGFFIQLLLEQLSKGVEHGHIHAHPGAKPSFALSIMLGLCLHAFIEGLPLSQYTGFHDTLHSHGEDSEDHHLLFGIILHKIPAAFALMILFIKSGYSRTMAWVCLLIFASMSPLGALATSGLKLDLPILANLVALVVGSFLHISTTILFEADDKRQHAVSWRKLAVIVAGLGLSMFTLH